jgi:hypothetical protein
MNFKIFWSEYNESEYCLSHASHRSGLAPLLHQARHSSLFLNPRLRANVRASSNGRQRSQDHPPFFPTPCPRMRRLPAAKVASYGHQPYRRSRSIPLVHESPAILETTSGQEGISSGRASLETQAFQSLKDMPYPDFHKAAILQHECHECTNGTNAEWIIRDICSISGIRVGVFPHRTTEK